MYYGRLLGAPFIGISMEVISFMCHLYVTDVICDLIGVT